MEKQNNETAPASWETPSGVKPLFTITPKTPVGFLNSMRLDSGGSSTQDSGYSSFTPCSSSGDSLIDTCHRCSIKEQNYAHSTPHSSLMCFCNPSSCHLPKISECYNFSMPCTLRLGPQFNSFDEALDSSLYNDHVDDNRMDVEEGSVEDSNYALGCEEKSMDLAEADFVMTPEPQENKDNRKDTLKKCSESININKLKDAKFAYTVVDRLSNRPNEESNDLTPTKKMKTNRFPIAAKKVVTLIKVVKRFSLCGIEQLDFLYQLSVKTNCYPVMKRILSYLSGKDLHNVKQVSSTWTGIVDRDFKSYDRWRKYIRNRNMLKENSQTPVKNSFSYADSPRSLLCKIDMNVRTPYQGGAHHVHSPPVSPKTARFRSFQKAGKQLKQGERLLSCPKCFFASQDTGDPVVQCTRSGCRHRFCFSCRGEITPNSNHRCRPLYSPRKCKSPSKTHTAGSQKSRQFLRRLSSLND